METSVAEQDEKGNQIVMFVGQHHKGKLTLVIVTVLVSISSVDAAIMKNIYVAQVFSVLQILVDKNFLPSI